AARCGAPPRAMAGRLLLQLRGWRTAVPRAVLPGPGPACRHRCGREEDEAAALLAMGFSQAQARRLRLLQPGLEPRRREEAAAELLLLGLSAEAALGLLERSPRLLSVAAARLKERAGYLRRLGLEGGR
ncbi:MTEF4 factor, partial [Odontophorus gujanensis]|nr:MTEF4 factor [Odontophorus gujanensis]